MAKNLLIVESPAKAKTIKKYLGNDFEVLASYGHVRDLLPKEGAVDTEHEFAMNYETIDRNKKHVDAIAKALKSATTLYLATDPDREGEAISWHLCELMKQKRLLKDKPVHRVAFYEITKTAVNEAVANPREISMDLVNAQQARRALDYLVGFNLSPLLWKKIRRGLSAGRVQSPALRLIVEREQEIQAFVAQEYWTIEASLAKEKQPFSAKLTVLNEDKLKQFDINNDKQAFGIREQLLKAAAGSMTVLSVEKKERKRQPPPPFTTSTLQQDAARRLGFSAKRTMQVAQQLYEGVETQEGSVGLITYMRTDSLNLSQDALHDIRQYIGQHYGSDNLPDQARFYKNQSKNAQEAHEAIRPTAVMRAPAMLKNALTSDQYKLYSLIWKRAVACQMVHATIDTVAVDLNCGDAGTFRATGSTIAKPGFMRLYQEGLDEGQDNEDKEAILPALTVGDVIKLIDIQSLQHFTEPPPRYSEATLIKALEEFGIGRPSTYATILSTLQQRDYAILDNKRFKPTDVGMIVAGFLTDYFTKYVNYDFTANLEDQLDAVSRGEKEWIPLLSDFWAPFIEQIHSIDKSVKRQDVTSKVIDEACPKCGKPLSIRLGKTGRFIGCTAYPECDYTRNIPGSEGATAAAPQVVEGRLCPQCNSPLLQREGRYGQFIGCSQYPKCTFIESAHKPVDTGVTCPKCHKGTIQERKSKRGKVFYSCNLYPKCDYALWNPPINEPCPKCQWPILTLKTTQRHGTEKICPQEGCGYKAQVE